jgi:hypothetical protein
LRATSLLAAAVIALLLASGANAIAIELTTTRLTIETIVLVHRPGDPYSRYLLQDGVGAQGADVSLSHDLGFARLDASARAASLHPSVVVDAREIDALGYDRVVAEVVTWWEADLRITGATWPVEVLVEALQSQTVVSEEFASPYPGSRSIRIFDEQGTTVFGMATRAEAEIALLEPERTYEVRVIFAAYVNASMGYQASSQRHLGVLLSLVPEPAPMLLLAPVALALAPLSRTRHRVLARSDR